MTVVNTTGGSGGNTVTVSPFTVLLVGIGLIVVLYSFKYTRPFAIGFTGLIVLGYLLFYYPVISSQIGKVVSGK